ncbi:hypothetical protein [Candidatus Avelusimicrobium caledoniensis]|uniref:hypothetical protein n=1 Tax=Candidatus Avelusimicrobium caledoniensis TaxID=3416220 RepID=UPI003D1493F2
MIRKCISAGLMCVLLSGFGSAQPLKQAAKGVKNFWKAPAHARQISGALESRVQRSYITAVQTQNQFPQAQRFLQATAGVRVTGEIPVVPKALYPQAPFLTNQNQLTNYFLAQNNRQLSKQLPFYQRYLQDVGTHVEDFFRNQQNITHEQELDMFWLAMQISPQISNLLIAEIHGFPEIAFNVAKLLEELKELQPQREIFVFTEFLPEGKIWGDPDLRPRLRSYIPAWQFASILDIPVIGLEPQFVEDNLDLTLSASAQGEIIWASPEALRLRNQRWLALIRSYREKYPNALFVIYAGEAHITYSRPHSLGQKLAGPSTFVAGIYPQYDPNCPDRRHMLDTSPFDQVTNSNFATQRVLKFTDPKLVRLAGFDAQIKVPLLRD